ncbi:hypothetical protein DJ468_02200, partial [Candidatus Liberibacter asiaticus]
LFLRIYSDIFMFYDLFKSRTMHYLKGKSSRKECFLAIFNPLIECLDFKEIVEDKENFPSLTIR